MCQSPLWTITDGLNTLRASHSFVGSGLRTGFAGWRVSFKAPLAYASLAPAAENLMSARGRLLQERRQPPSHGCWVPGVPRSRYFFAGAVSSGGGDAIRGLLHAWEGLCADHGQDWSR